MLLLLCNVRHGRCGNTCVVRYLLLICKIYFICLCVCDYSDNTQRMSKYGNNKEVYYEPQASSMPEALTIF